MSSAGQYKKGDQHQPSGTIEASIVWNEQDEKIWRIHQELKLNLLIHSLEKHFRNV